MLPLSFAKTAGLGAPLAYPSIPAPTEIPLSRNYPKATRLTCTRIAAGGNLSYFIVDRKDLTTGRESIDLLATGNGQFGGIGNGTWAHAPAPMRVKTVSGLSEFREKEGRVMPIAVRDVSAGNAHVAVVLVSPSCALLSPSFRVGGCRSVLRAEADPRGDRRTMPSSSREASSLAATSLCSVITCTIKYVQPPSHRLPVPLSPPADPPSPFQARHRQTFQPCHPSTSCPTPLSQSRITRRRTRTRTCRDGNGGGEAPREWDHLAHASFEDAACVFFLFALG